MKRFSFFYLLTVLTIILLSCSPKKMVADTSTVDTKATVEKLDEDQLKRLVSLLEKRDNHADGLLLLKNADYYRSNASKLSVGQLESFVEILQESRKENDDIMELCRRANVSIEGGVEAAINMYSWNSKSALENLMIRGKNDMNYSMLIDIFKKQIDINKKKEYVMPDGDLIYYSHKVSGGMLRGTYYEIERKDDGKTYLTSNANFRDMGDTTIVVPDTALVHIKKIISDYKVYEIAPLYVSPYMIFDAPSTFVVVKFSSGKEIHSDGRQSSPRNDGLDVINTYLLSLLPEPKQ